MMTDALQLYQPLQECAASTVAFGAHAYAHVTNIILGILARFLGRQVQQHSQNGTCSNHLNESFSTVILLRPSSYVPSSYGS